MSFGVQSIGNSDSTQSGSSTGLNLRQYADLGLTEEQRKKIREILSSAKANGTDPADVQSQISSVLTDAQKAQLAQEQASGSSATAPTGPPQGPPPAGGPPPPPDVFANLNLTDDQKSKIKTILDSLKSGTTTADDAKTQIEALLTPTQQAQFEQNVQNAQAQFAGQQQSGADASSSSSSDSTSSTSSSSTSSTATLASGVTLDDIKKQIAAAASVLLKQIEAELASGVTTTPTPTTTSTS